MLQQQLQDSILSHREGGREVDEFIRRIKQHYHNHITVIIIIIMITRSELSAVVCACEYDDIDDVEA